jgi:hypothetical protein
MSTKNMKNKSTPIYITMNDVTGLRYKFIFNMSTMNMKNKSTTIYITLYDVTGLLNINLYLKPVTSYNVM